MTSVVTTNVEVISLDVSNTSVVAVLEKDVLVSENLSSSFITQEVVNTIVISGGTEGTTIVASGAQGPQGPPGIAEDDMPYSKKIDFVTDSILYTGEAAVGSLASASVWRIKRTIIAGDSDIDVTWADGTANFTKVWADRATYTYS